uniref:RT_RNaseH_2 domain-containing protein n=1 Tax=Caenorhabditis japonica TaxID=281687 RepID=A0A8R1E1V3_CAEJA
MVLLMVKKGANGCEEYQVLLQWPIFHGSRTFSSHTLWIRQHNNPRSTRLQAHSKERYKTARLETTRGLRSKEWPRDYDLPGGHFPFLPLFAQFTFYRSTVYPFQLLPLTNIIGSSESGFSLLKGPRRSTTIGRNLQQNIFPAPELRKVLMTFRDFNLKASPKKCEFAKESITFLGHEISKTTYTPDKANVAKIVEFPTPTNVNEVRMVVGMTGFFRKFIPRFSEITEPLTHLTRIDKKFEWNAEQQAAFEKLRDALATEPVLGFTNYDAPFHIFCDASAVAQGAALMQYRPGSEKDYYAIAYASRTISDPETLLRHLDNTHRRKKKEHRRRLPIPRQRGRRTRRIHGAQGHNRVSGAREGSTGHSLTNRTLVVKRNQPTSVLDITKEQDGDPDILVIKKVLQEAEAVDLKVEEVEVEEIGAEEKSQERGEVETHPPPAQIDVFDLPAESIVRTMELPAHMITSEVHPFASSYVEPIEKMDLPDSAAKRMAYYCTLDMIQAGRNKSITDARIINETRPTSKPIRRENLQTIDFWPNHADGALPYVLRNRDERRWWAVPLFAETVADDRPDLHMVILDVFANDLGNGGRVDVNDYLFGDIVLITSFMALPNSRLADIVSTFDNIHRTESHRFSRRQRILLAEEGVLGDPGQTLYVTARTNLFTTKGIKNEPGPNAIATLFHPKLHPGQFLKSILEDDYATILQRTNGHLTSDPTPPSVVTIKHLSRRDAEDFDAMPQPFRRFNGDKGKALAALVECAFMGFTGILAAANKNRDVRAYATTITNCT